MGFAQGYSCRLFKDITELISEEAILEYYTGITQIPCVVSSPLRVDNKPSFGIYYTENGIYYQDYAKGEWGSLSHLLMKKFKYDSLNQLRDKLEKDLSEIKKLDKFIIRQTKDSYEGRTKTSKSKVVSELNVRIREWKDHDIEFWSKSGINRYWLEFGTIYPISHIKINDNTFTAEKYAYCYVEYKDNHPSIKIYQPYSEKMKWLNNHNSSVWDLWVQAMNSDSDTLIITSSRKDALCLWSNMEIPSVSLQAEGYLPKPHVVSILSEKFPYIYCLYDNDYDKTDNYGREYGRRLSELYGFKQIEIPEFYLSKDPSDLYKNFGETIFKQVIQQILKK